MWVRAKREDDAMCVWFGSLCGVVVINLSPLVCCVREDATLLKSLKLSVSVGETGHLAAEAVEGAALALERVDDVHGGCLLYTSPSPRDATLSRMPSSA